VPLAVEFRSKIPLQRPQLALRRGVVFVRLALFAFAPLKGIANIERGLIGSALIMSTCPSKIVLLLLGPQDIRRPLPVGLF
jgi:hypothetical protein